MPYFKYVTPDRVDVVANLKIRYTQVSALNDPFEALPAVEHVAINRAMKQEARRIVREESAPYLKGASKGEAKRARRRMRQKLIDEFDSERGPAAARHFQDVVRQITDTTTGILSLSKVCDNILMWSHYADCHRGFVIEFDADHPYFSYGTEEVVYTDQRPKMPLRSGKHSAEILTTKSRDWAYEQEVRRMEALTSDIRPLKGGHSLLAAPNELKEDPDAIHLFDLPRDVIAGVILGWKSDALLARRIEEAIADQDLRDVKVRYAVPSDDAYCMNVVANRSR